jgi:hypothetical protein
MVHRIVKADYDFEGKEQVREVFTAFRRLFTNLNYAPDGSAEYDGFADDIESQRRRYIADTGSRSD